MRKISAIRFSLGVALAAVGATTALAQSNSERLLDSLRDARDPWEAMRDPQPVKQFIPIAVEA